MPVELQGGWVVDAIADTTQPEWQEAMLVGVRIGVLHSVIFAVALLIGTFIWVCIRLWLNI